MLTFVETALADLIQAQQQGKVSATPVSEGHYLAVWLTRAIKQQRFASSIAKYLLGWQKQARSQGTKAELKKQFQSILATYQHPGLVSNDSPISRERIEALLDDLADQGWQVVSEHAVDRKVTHFTAGQASLVICRNNLEQALSSNLVEPLVLYVRGPVPELVQQAAHRGLLLFKTSDYKSKVKYHGEYRIFPHNEGPKVPEII
ncbi:DUF2913 family protein [Motilimonas pumila]|uniref:DUF2913 family protein n=2 Tax=Motilimonas pumila TaxID=2303987 RepID=A0A418YFQ2_9GAMM|nr:DUF2913 family protein [Motilimonas pumila]